MNEENTAVNLAEERLRLEREALAVERERLVSARMHAEEEARIAQTRHRPFLAVTAVALLAASCFAGGLLTGISVMEGRQQRQREARLAQALSRLNLPPDAVTTNIVPLMSSSSGDGAHRDVAVVVIQ